MSRSDLPLAVCLTEFGACDLALVERWLRAAHVRRFWGDPEGNARLLREPPAGTRRAMIEADGRKVGLVMWQHPTRQELDDFPSGRCVLLVRQRAHRED